MNPRAAPRARRGPHGDHARAPFPLRWGLLATLALPASIAGAGELEAQWKNTTLAVWSGVPLPLEDLANWHDGGFDLAASLERRVKNRWSVVFIGGRSYLDPVPRNDLGLGHEPGPPVVQWRYTLGLLLDLSEPTNPWQASFNAGIGGATYDVKREEAAPGYYDREAAGPIRDVDVSTSLAVTGGIRMGRRLEDLVGLPLTLFFHGQAIGTFNDAADPSDYLGRDFLFTNSAGLSYSF